jgi:tetratricopeptide (TPR) repeat protein
MNVSHPCARVLLALALASRLAVAAESVRASRGQITIPTYPWAAVKHPYFRGTDKVNIYPYPMLDFLSRDQTNRTYQTVILENEYLRVTILPELGGRVHEVIDKTTGQPMFYVNHVIKPGLIGQCGAWISGGIEWNTGPQGHTVSCMQPVAVEILPRAKDGSRSVAIGETERIYRTKWTVVVTLRPGRSFLEERIRIYNPTETIRPYYFWNCTAVPNTQGFRFIYPMTLGMDHSGEKFFSWPVHEGKDLTKGTNYQDASSIFAYHCDQDFFGSYNDDLERGVVSCANHQQLPGKKAWTWGHGSYGTMHQADLTDHDGPYNEVQTGPLLTQGEVGRLDPCEAVEWQEWWFPIHGVGGFNFANTNLAANLSLERGKARLRLMSTQRWPEAKVIVGGRDSLIAKAPCKLDPAQPTEVELEVGEHLTLRITVGLEGHPPLADWVFPNPIPTRTAPKQRESPQTASEFAVAGWQRFLFAQFPEAEAQFQKALAKDPHCPDAHIGLAHLNLDRDPARALEAARVAVATDADLGAAHYVLAVAAQRSAEELWLKGGRDDRLRMQLATEAVDAAWKAALDPATAVAARTLIAKLYLLQHARRETIRALAAPGPWQSDPAFRNRVALALSLGASHEQPDRQQADALANQNLELDPLDWFARSIRARNGRGQERAASLKGATGEDLLELEAQGKELGGDFEAARFVPPEAALLSEGMAQYHRGQDYTAVLQRKSPPEKRPRSSRQSGGQLRPGDWPFRPSDVTLLRAAVQRDPADGRARLLLGHALFHLGRYAEGRQMWKKAAELGAEPVVAYRALGMAAKTLDGDLPSAREWLEKASQADPGDAIVARDLANVLFALADKTGAATEKRELAAQARDRLQAAFAEGKGRSDFVALLARAQTRLEDYAAAAKMLDSVRVTIWEGAHEVHDLFEQAHLALGEAHLKGNRPGEALAEFNRALEYPANLATGKTENTREAHIHYLRGNALAALGRRADALAAWQKAAHEPASGDARKDRAREDARRALEPAGTAR